MVSLVRSEDRKPSRRVFPLLQNLDLDSVTFAQVQSTGDPISIEDMNEQEMVDLIIVNLARLCVAGEWDGLLSAGGGGGSGYGVLSPLTETGSYDGFEIASLAPWGHADANTGVLAAAGYPVGYPFVSPKTGDLASIEIYCSTASATSTLKVAIYSQDADTHLPSTLLGFVEFDTSSTGSIEQSVFSSTVSLVEGTQYWAVQARGSSAYASMWGVAEEARAGIGVSSGPTQLFCAANFVGNWNTDDPVDDVGTLSQYLSGNSLRLVLKW